MDVYQIGVLIIATVLVLMFLMKKFKKPHSTIVEPVFQATDDIDDKLHQVTNIEASAATDSQPEHFIAPESSSPSIEDDELIIINVVAKTDCYFSSYDLLQAIAATGMQFGAMNIFHYYRVTPSGKSILFSLASATEPGEFDLNSMGDFSCAGLCLFMNLRQVANAEDTFALMFDTAEQLADDLDGELRAGPHTPWNEEVMQGYQKKVLEYQYLL